MSDQLADKFFTARRLADRLEDDLTNELLRICRVSPDDTDTWPCGDFIFDDYDSSFEFRECKEPEKWAEVLSTHSDELAALGFWQCWVCEKPAGEYDKGIFISFRKEEPSHDHADDKAQDVG